MEEPTLSEQQEYIYNWIQSVPNAEFLKVSEWVGGWVGSLVLAFE